MTLNGTAAHFGISTPMDTGILFSLSCALWWTPLCLCWGSPHGVTKLSAHITGLEL